MHPIRIAAALVLLGGCFTTRDDGPDARPAPDAPPVELDAAVVTCPPDYTRDDQTGSCYRFLDPSAAATWLLAEATCELDASDGVAAHLVVIDDGNEAARLLARAGGSGFWIGASDHAAEGAFRAVTGAAPATMPWASGEPDDAGGREDCAGYRPGDTLWRDLPCSEALPVVCELDGRRPAAPATYCDTDAPSDCGRCGNACSGSDPCVAQVCIVPPPTCPLGYVQSDVTVGTCHKLVSAPATWQAAELDCEDDLFEGVGSHLVVIETAAERDYVRNLALGAFWIGASDHQVEGTFRWVTGAPVVFPDWITGEPNDDFNTEDCAEYRSATTLRNDRACTINQRYVCEWDRTPAAAAPTWCDTDTATSCGACGTACPAGQPCLGQYCQPPCPTGYTPAIGSCYRLGTMAAQTWQASEAGCEADVHAAIPAHLAVVGSPDERAWLDAQISGGFWIGLSDHDAEGTFRWVTGAPIGPFANWGSGEPNNDFNTEDCVEYRETTDRWNDRTCSATAAWACEWDGVAPAASPTWCDTDTATDCGVCGRACVPLIQQCAAQTCQAI